MTKPIYNIRSGAEDLIWEGLVPLDDGRYRYFRHNHMAGTETTETLDAEEARKILVFSDRLDLLEPLGLGKRLPIVFSVPGYEARDYHVTPSNGTIRLPKTWRDRMVTVILREI